MEMLKNGVRGWAGAAAGAGVVLATAGLCAAGGPDITITTLIKQGDPIPGHGVMSNPPIDVNVNNDGVWLTTLPSSTSGRVILTSEGVYMAEGDVLDGLVVGSLANIHKSLNNLGDIIHRPGFDGEAHSGMVLNQDVLITRDQISTADAFTPGTPFAGFFRAKINDNGRALMIATVNDENLSGNSQQALIWLDYDPSDGSLTETVLAKRDDQLPGQIEGVTVGTFGTGSERFAINNNDDVIYTVGLLGGDSATNAAVYVNDTLVAQKGDFGPFKDATYNLGTSAATRVDINDHGDYVIRMLLAGGPTDLNQAIVRNNIHRDGPDELVIRRGDPVPGLDGEYFISGLGTGAQPIMTNNGDVVWFGVWPGDNGNERGLFINDQLIVHSGVTTTPEGDLITNIAGTTNSSNGLGDAFMVSDNGKYIIARAVLNESTSERAVILIEVDDPQPKCAGPADINCDGVVNVADMLLLLAAWGECEDCPEDLNEDGVVDVSDLLILLSQWG